MQLSKLLEILTDVGAPVLKTVISTAFGPAAGNVAGKGLELLGEALGVEPEPEQIVMAYERDPLYAREQIMQVEQGRGEMLILAVSEVNQTIRAEMQSESFLTRAWRPAFGFAFILAYLAGVIAVVYPILEADDPFMAAVQLGNTLLLLLSLGGSIMGAYTWRRTTEKLKGLIG